MPRTADDNKTKERRRGKKNYSREVTERTGSNKETDWRKERDDGVWAADNVALL